MPDLQEQLQAILGDPQAMGQITAIAQALAGPAQPPREGEYAPVEPPPAEERGPQTQHSALPGPAGGLSDPDPRLLRLALRVLSEYSAQDDKKVALLSALKPFLKAERLEKMEKAERAARLTRAVRAALHLMKETEEPDV